jgi:predicted MFS family arabinose efflux permease
VVLIARRHVPETLDPDAPSRLDVTGAGLAVLGLGAVTYALIAAGSGWSARVVGVGTLGLAALVGFARTERRSSHPMVPPALFAHRQFTAVNVVTFAIYAALGGVFFFLVVGLQVVSGFSPVLAGAALLPVTAIMLALSAWSGELATRIGPRLPITLGALICAAGVLLMLRVDTDSTYLADVLPAVTLFGLGLSLIVSPLTATVLGAAPAHSAGIASGVNNAVARAASLLAVAILPVMAGIAGDEYQRPAAFLTGFRLAMVTTAMLLVIGGLIAIFTLRNPEPEAPVQVPDRRHHCGVDGPPLQTRQH